MWIKPEVFKRGAMWSIAASNEYFELVRVRSLGSKFVDFPFKIILKTYEFQLQTYSC